MSYTQQHNSTRVCLLAFHKLLTMCGKRKKKKNDRKRNLKARKQQNERVREVEREWEKDTVSVCVCCACVSACKSLSEEEWKTEREYYYSGGFRGYFWLGWNILINDPLARNCRVLSQSTETASARDRAHNEYRKPQEVG